MSNRRVLVAPLNWGLGHVARCVPLIAHLEKSGAEVLLGSDGVALDLLRAEFPHLPALELPSYRITYGSSNMVWNIARQLPRILYAVQAEHRAVEKLVQQHEIQGIVSDNRYGCFSRKIPSAILTHQLFPRMPRRVPDWPARRLVRSALEKFDEIWVPDNPGDDTTLSGELSHGPFLPQKTKFIGPLTRLRAYPKEREWDVAVVLSGPEPQRTLLENRLMDQAISLPQNFIFIQGMPKTKRHFRVGENIEVVSYLTSRELNDVLMSARIIVCRSGYSSLMDLAALGKKAILIPTPGQTEQEYLADFFASRGIFLAQSQDKLNLETAILSLGNTKGIQPGAFDVEAFKTVLNRWLSGL